MGVSVMSALLAGWRGIHSRSKSGDLTLTGSVLSQT